MADDVVFVNVAEGLKRVMNNSKIYVRLLTKFKEDPNLKELETDLASGEIEKARTPVHTLKGIAANLSLMELYKQSLELEAQIKAGSLKENQLTIFKGTYTQTMTEIDKVIAQYG